VVKPPDFAVVANPPDPTAVANPPDPAGIANPPDLPAVMPIHCNPAAVASPPDPAAVANPHDPTAVASPPDASVVASPPDPTVVASPPLLQLWPIHRPYCCGQSTWSCCFNPPDPTAVANPPDPVVINPPYPYESADLADSADLSWWEWGIIQSEKPGWCLTDQDRYGQSQGGVRALFLPCSIHSKDNLPDLFAFRNEVLHTVLYVVYAMQFGVFPKNPGKTSAEISVKSSRVRNPRKVFSSLAATGA
jgi:hypothetical protein